MALPRSGAPRLSKAEMSWTVMGALPNGVLPPKVAGSRPAGHCGCISAARKETAHGTVPARRRAARDLGREPDGDRRLRVRRVLPSRPGRARPPVQGHGLLARGEAPLEGRDALPSG